VWYVREYKDCCVYCVTPCSLVKTSEALEKTAATFTSILNPKITAEANIPATLLTVLHKVTLQDKLIFKY
jgi:hypothetical protein